MIDDDAVWVVMAVVGLGSFLFRFSFIHLIGRIDEVPPLLERALGFVPAAVLAALVLPGLVTASGDPLSAGSDRLVAGAFAAVAAWRTEDMLATITVGMGTLWLLTWLG